MLCQLAVATLQGLAPTFGEAMVWSLIDVSTANGLQRLREVRRQTGRRVPVPAVLLNGDLAFEGIPEEEALVAALAAATGRLHAEL